MVKLTEVEKSNRDSSNGKKKMLYNGRFVTEVEAIEESNRISCSITQIILYLIYWGSQQFKIQPKSIDTNNLSACSGAPIAWAMENKIPFWITRSSIVDDPLSLGVV